MPSVDEAAPTLLKTPDSDAFARTELPASDAPTIRRDPGGDASLFAVLPSSHPHEVDPAPAPLTEETFEARYEARALLGQGGMGEVRLCKDNRIGREIALKVIRPGAGSRSDARARFEREARVQGQLEHPSVVPVYDLGIRPDGSAFFTMKRVRGETLGEVIDKLRRGDPEALATHTRRRLLGAFSSLCLAVAFAHARHVVHRDLKPGNIMLGAYGELYILDWGLAKILGEDEAPVSRAWPEREDPIEAPMSQRHRTEVGAMMGTPGYMAPEQIRGEVDALDQRADIFALGAILFELLTLEPLFGVAGDTVAKVLATTLQGADARASARAPAGAIPTELDAVCVRATRPDPADRFASAREMHEALERFLDGDRDLTQRHQMAERHAVRAAELFGEHQMESALREASAALALEPAHPAALGLMVRLLIDVPANLPPEARAELDQRTRDSSVQQSSGPAVAYGLLLGAAPMMLLLGVRDMRLFALLTAIAAAAFATASWAMRRARFEGAARHVVYAVGTLSIMVSSAFMGPFILVPSLLAANTVAFVVFGHARDRRLFLGVGAAALVVPALLEIGGILPASYVFSDAGMTVAPHLTSFPRVPTLLFLLAANLLAVLTPPILFSRVRDMLTRNEERLFAYTWRLRQLLPVEVRTAAIPSGPPEPDRCNHASLHEKLRLPQIFDPRGPARSGRPG